MKKNKNSQPQTKFTGSYKKKECTYSRLKHYTYSRYSKRYLERPSYGVQNKWNGFSSQ